MEAIAKTKHLKGSPRKARLVIDMIRGQRVSRALSILKFTDKRAAAPISKCLSSAIANATYKAEQQNIAIDPDDLWIRTCFVDMGPTKNRRRMRPAPQGRAYREQRHYCHITIEVTSDEKAKTEKELKGIAAAARRAAEPAKPKAEKKAAPKAEKKADKAAEVEEVETPANVEENLETPVTVEEGTEATVAQDNAEIADAKNASTDAEAHNQETKPADDEQLRTNEELERQ
jgi:large subunit ribosomal protein L22